MSWQSQTWFVGLGLIGAVAALVGASLAWLVLTQPVTLARLVAGGF